MGAVETRLLSGNRGPLGLAPRPGKHCGTSEAEGKAEHVPVSGVVGPTLVQKRGAVICTPLPPQMPPCIHWRFVNDASLARRWPLDEAWYEGKVSRATAELLLGN